MGNFISSSAFSTITGLISLISGFAGSVIVARMLGPEGTGEVSFVLFVAMSGAILAGVGVPNVLLRYMPAYDRPGNPGGGLARLLLPYFALPTVLGMAGLAAYGLWLHASGVEAEHAPATWLMTSILFAVYTTSVVGDAASRGLNRFSEVTRYVFVGCLVQVPAILIGGYFFGVAGALFGYVCRHLPQALSLRGYVARRPDAEACVTPNMKATGRNSWFSSVVGMIVWTRVEFFFLGLYFAASEIGHYAAGLALAGLVVQLPHQMLGALTPHIGRHHDNGDVGRVLSTYHRIMRWLSILILPVCFGGAAILGELMPLLFGPEFADAVPMGQVLVAFAFLTAFSAVPSTIITACERSDFFLLASPVAAVLSIAAFAIVVPEGAGFGSAWARALVHGIWVVWLIGFCWRRLALPLNVKDLLLIALAALASAAAAYGVLLEIKGLLGLLLAIGAGALAYALALRLLRVVPHDDVVALTSNLPSALPGALSRIAYRVMSLVAAPPALSKMN